MGVAYMEYTKMKDYHREANENKFLLSFQRISLETADCLYKRDKGINILEAGCVNLHAEDKDRIYGQNTHCHFHPKNVLH
jgi:hypothetical protein